MSHATYITPIQEHIHLFCHACQQTARIHIHEQPITPRTHHFELRINGMTQWTNKQPKHTLTCPHCNAPAYQFNQHDIYHYVLDKHIDEHQQTSIQLHIEQPMSGIPKTDIQSYSAFMDAWEKTNQPQNKKPFIEKRTRKESVTIDAYGVTVASIHKKLTTITAQDATWLETHFKHLPKRFQDEIKKQYPDAKKWLYKYATANEDNEWYPHVKLQRYYPLVAIHDLYTHPHAPCILTKAMSEYLRKFRQTPMTEHDVHTMKQKLCPSWDETHWRMMKTQTHATHWLPSWVLNMTNDHAMLTRILKKVKAHRIGVHIGMQCGTYTQNQLLKNVHINALCNDVLHKWANETITKTRILSDMAKLEYIITQTKADEPWDAYESPYIHVEPLHIKGLHEAFVLVYKPLGHAVYNPYTKHVDATIQVHHLLTHDMATYLLPKLSQHFMIAPVRIQQFGIKTTFTIRTQRT